MSRLEERKPDVELVSDALEEVSLAICRDRDGDSLTDATRLVALSLAPDEPGVSVANSLDRIADAITRLAKAIEGLKK